MEFYLDESGNTGGISKLSFENSYGGQEIFTLAAIGIADENEFSRSILPLLGHYKINATELKSSRVYKPKPKFIADLFSIIRANNWPIFVEAVDKKFMLTANIVNSLVFPGYCFDAETRKTSYVRNVFAEYLYYHLPDSIYTGFLELCAAPSANGLLTLIDKFTVVIGTNKNDVSGAIINSLSMTRDDVMNDFLGKNDDISAFLPIPDKGKRGKLIWMLPNLSSFVNIYARVNLFMQGNLSSVKIYHDEQLQYDDIIDGAKRDVENLPHDKIGFVSDSSDYIFHKSADLFFKTSHDSIGIQIADLIAGFVRRYIEEVLGNKKIDGTIHTAHRILMTMNKEELGLGLNMVFPVHDFNRVNASTVLAKSHVQS
ncbi:MAG: DUF3800 domain-containing protein [Candidatus Thiodiazotropha sp.]